MKACPNASETKDTATAFCDTRKSTPSSAAQQSAPDEKQKKRKKGLFGALLSLLLAALLVFVTILTNFFGLVSPLVPLGSAALKTLRAESITVTQTQTDNEGRSVTKTRLVTNAEKREYTELSERDGRTVLIRDGVRYLLNEKTLYASHENAAETVKAYFDLLDAVGKKKDRDVETFFKESGLEKYVEADEVENTLKRFYDEFLNNDRWLKDVLGFEKRGGTYTFEPDVDQTLEDLFDFVLDSEMLTDMGETIVKFIRKTHEGAKEARKFPPKFKISFTVSLGGYLTKVQTEVKNGEDKQTLKVEFTDVKKTEISETEIEALLDKVQKYETENQ